MNEPEPATGPLGRTSIRSVVGFLVFCELASGFTQGFYPPLLKDFAEYLNITDANVIWFLSVQTLAAAVSVPLLSKLGDLFGHRRLLRIAIVSVLIGTIITAVVPNYYIVLAGRVLVGPLAVWLPLEIALIHGRITGDDARKAVGLLVSMLTGGAILGTMVSGVIATLVPNMVVVMLTPTVLVLGAVYAVFFKVPDSDKRAPTRVDYIGFLGIAVFMIALLLGLRGAEEEGLASPGALIPLLIGVVTLVLWVFWELRQDAPAVDVRLITSRSMGPIYIAGLFFGMVMFGGQAPITTFLGSDPAVTGYGFHATPGLISGVLGLVMVLATLGAAMFTKVARAVGIRPLLMLGAGSAAVGNLLLLVVNGHLWGFFLSALLQGVGYGFLLGGLPARLAELAPSNATGIATGVYNSLRTLGGSLSGAIFAAVLGAATAAGLDFARLSGYLNVWLFSGIVLALASLALYFLPRDKAGDTDVAALAH